MCPRTRGSGGRGASAPATWRRRRACRSWATPKSWRPLPGWAMLPIGNVLRAGGTVWRRWGSGPAIVLLHGGAGSWKQWSRNIPHLAASRTVWVPDLPGMGDSADAPAPRDHEAIATVLAENLRELIPGESFDVVGFSFGGIVAGFVAAKLPGRVRSLVLVGAGGLGLRKANERILKSWRALEDPAAREAAHRFNLSALMLSKGAEIDQETLALYVADVVRTRVNSARSSRTAVLKACIVKLGIPVHGIWGREDVTAHAKFDEIHVMLRPAHPAAQLHVVGGAGHWVQYERPDAFHGALAQALGPSM
ncbi:MAG: alpha/beta fold hydrolase [Betaproteobacteria bacterium]|nr:alpha/beta fold hydrolase [Betaproteobacteria bacterium]